MDLLLPELGLIVWQTLAFLILLFLLTRFAWKPIIGAVRSREQRIDEALKTAEKARAEMQALKADNEKLLNEAREERNRILREAKEAGERIITDAREQAREQARKIAEEAKREIENQKQSALAAIKSESARLAVDIAEKLLKRELQDKANQEAYLKDLLDHIDLN